MSDAPAARNAINRNIASGWDHTTIRLWKKRRIKPSWEILTMLHLPVLIPSFVFFAVTEDSL